MKNNIILIGYMGCGKTTMAIKLSYKERVAVIDTDKMIEHRQNRTITQIFDEDGEAAFRQMETDILKEIETYKDRYIISVGGGLPVREENRLLLKNLGCVIYLRAKPETIYERLKHDTSRPLLRGENPREKISQMIAQRGSLYENAATDIIDVDGKAFEEVLCEIQKIAESRR